MTSELLAIEDLWTEEEKAFIENYERELNDIKSISDFIYFLDLHGNDYKGNLSKLDLLIEYEINGFRSFSLRVTPSAYTLTSCVFHHRTKGNFSLTHKSWVLTQALNLYQVTFNELKEKFGFTEEEDDLKPKRLNITKDINMIVKEKEDSIREGREDTYSLRELAYKAHLYNEKSDVEFLPEWYYNSRVKEILKDIFYHCDLEKESMNEREERT